MNINEWFIGLLPAVQVAIVAATGVVITAIVSLINGVITATSEHFARLHNKQLKQKELLFDKQAQNAKEIISKINEFYVNTFLVVESALQESRKITMSGTPSDAVIPFHEAQDTCKRQRQIIKEWFDYEGLIYCAWFSNSNAILDDFDNIADWYTDFFDDFDDALENAADIYGKYDFMDPTPGFDARKARGLWQKERNDLLLDVASFKGCNKDIRQKTNILQKKLLSYLD